MHYKENIGMNNPKRHSVWNHVETGNQYQVRMIVNESTIRPNTFPVSVVYARVGSGEKWCRPVADFMKRMIPAPSAK